mgnify:FL=1
MNPLCSRCGLSRDDENFGKGKQGCCKKCRAAIYKERKLNPSSRYCMISAFKELSNEEIISMINVKTQKEIAEKYGVSPSSINKELRRRGLFRGDSNRRTRRIEASLPLTNEDELYITYRWIGSSERKSYNNRW